MCVLKLSQKLEKNLFKKKKKMPLLKKDRLHNRRKHTAHDRARVVWRAPCLHRGPDIRALSDNSSVEIEQTLRNRHVTNNISAYLLKIIRQERKK